jgi:glycine oxidase
MQDVLIIGGGVIGLTLALRLAEQGVTSAVLDQNGLGQESSWAGAGMLPPGCPDKAQSPEARLRAASHVLWPTLSAELREATGIDNGFRRCGGLEVRLAGPSHELDGEIKHWRSEGVDVIPLEGSALTACEPGLSAEVSAAYHLPEMGQVRNPRHVKALIAACTAKGVRLLPGTPVWQFDRSGERILAVETSSGRFKSRQFVIAGGAWSGRLLEQVGCRAAVRPLRGQIVLLSQPRSPVNRVVTVGTRYLVPRGDGRLLIGSTEEAADFDKHTTAAGVGGLIEFAVRLSPGLGAATVERTWAGLRPQSPDGLPYLGRIPHCENLFVAAGHFRAGLQLSPISAALLTQVLLGQPTALPLAPYAVDRPAATDEYSVPGA